MTIPLYCLVAIAIWGFVLILIEIAGKTRIAGPQWNAGNRDAAPQFPAWIERCGRALSNHKENFPLFATGIIVVHLAGREGKVTTIAALVFVAARIAHGLLYIAGVTGLRSAAYTVGVIASLAVLSSLVL